MVADCWLRTKTNTLAARSSRTGLIFDTALRTILISFWGGMCMQLHMRLVYERTQVEIYFKGLKTRDIFITVVT